ncbi:MAG TPA: glycosyltransferase family 39 protein [Candidatus Krumholzibacteria bacterium]|nr:glycosyltransferase family 39 protein [Candidatus Krumholzibacteria bacterium]
MKRPHPGLFVVLAAAAAVHIAVASLDFGTLARNGFLYDDSFYAFQIARNIAHGFGPTFDGLHLTNGFQPLYVMLLVPVFMLTGSSASIPVHIALGMSALCMVFSALLLYRLVARRASETAALIATAAWAFSPIVTRQTANGLETALALLLLAGSVTYYLERIRGIASPSRREFATMGVLLGLSFLARADLGLLALVMALDYLNTLRRRAPAHWRANLATTVAIGLLVCAPWMTYGLIAVGSPIPESGRATRFLSLAYAPFFDLGPSSLATDGPSAEFVGEHVAHSVGTLKLIPVLHPFFRALQKFGDRVPFGGPVRAGANVAEILALAGFGVWWFRRRRAPRGAGAREFDFLLLLALVFVAAYSTWVFGLFFYLRYYYPLYFIGALFTGLMLDDLITWLASKPLAVRRMALAASGVYAAALLFMGYTSAFRTTPVYGFYDAARWVATHTEASDTIGVFQGGAIGYLSNRRVVNLDGKVNGEAFAALREHRLDAYVRASGINLVMDSARVLNMFLGPWSEADRKRIEANSFFAGGEHGVPGWIGYRVSPSAMMNAGMPGTAGPHSQPGPNP